jgi:GH24 family phage-related lysozyme (muramidase)
VTDSLLNYIRSTERFTPTAFWDNKQWTNGYGTKAKYPTGGPDDTGPRETISQSEAESRFITYTNNEARKVGNFGQSKKYKWGQNQVDALTSFIFNGGSGWLRQVTNDGTRTNAEIADAMLLYNKSDGKESSGLIKRRQQEAAWFKTNMVSAADGGAFSGPRSGYRAVLHGPEAVVPLPDGRTIPVTIAGLAEHNERLSQVLSAIETRMGSTGSTGITVSDTLLRKMDDLIRVASDQLGVSGKILKAQA